MKNTEDENRTREQAKAQYESILEMLLALNNAEKEEDEEEIENAIIRITEDPLSVQIRTGWYNPGVNPEPEEFEILLCTGGPAVRIIGELDKYNQPVSAKIQYQDWFTPWEDYYNNIEEEKILKYCSLFYFGE